MTRHRVVLFFEGDERAIRSALSSNDTPATVLQVLFAALDIAPGGERRRPGLAGLAADCDLAAVVATNVLWPASGGAGPDFDLVMPSVDVTEQTLVAEVIPLSLVRRHAELVVDSTYGQILRDLSGSAARHKVCIGPAAPREHGQSDANRRLLKIWTLQQQALASFCRAQGLVFLGNPHDSRTPSGYQRPRFAGAGDGSGVAYWQLVMGQLARVLREPMALPAALF